MTVKSVPENVVALADPQKKVKAEKKPKLEPILPVNIVEVARLAIRSMRDSGQVYPDITEDSDEDIRMHLFAYLQAPNFAGLIARIGKKPVGLALGHIITRPYGKPSRVVEVTTLWVEPTHRALGIGKALWAEYLNRIKAVGVYHWQAHTDVLAEKIVTHEKGSLLLSVVGGRI